MWSRHEMEERIEKVVQWLREQNTLAQTQGLVCGISGGVDSAVIGGLCKKAFAENSLGVIMPCYSNPADKEDALLVTKALDLDVIEIDLGQAHAFIYDQFPKILYDKSVAEETKKMSQGNLKARLRMSALYTVANLRNYLVVGTDNAAESYTGYFTKYGDGGVDLLPISSLTKTEVRAWAEVLGIPDKIVKRTPTAGLWQGQSDEDEMGITYQMIDRYLIGEKIPQDAVEKIENLHKISEHKRCIPPTIELPQPERLD